jgi:hypothetical protein
MVLFLFLRISVSGIIFTLVLVSRGRGVKFFTQCGTRGDSDRCRVCVSSGAPELAGANLIAIAALAVTEMRP